MIVVTRISGTRFALNPDLIERCEANPETIVTLVNGAKYMVLEPLTAIVDLVAEFRAEVLHRSYSTGVNTSPRPAPSAEKHRTPGEPPAEALAGAVNPSALRNLIELPTSRLMPADPLL